MEKDQVSKRLYVGGLGHTVSKAELQERFGKFGRVVDAEIITRKDDQGNPVKTFAYISVTMSDVDLKKCMSALNKTKWKGGTLQIELAKESFLHRLAVEREEAKLQKEKPQRNDKARLLQSLEKAGVVDFHMKAVPGTEVPDHKNWVVGKFGRVLPVLHLRNQHKNKISFTCSLTQTNIVKYDPSKYCHNLRKLEPDSTRVVPVSELTWHLEERDESLNKKRRGELPVTKKPPKKLRQLSSEAQNGAVCSSGCQSHSKKASSLCLDQRSKSNEKSKLSLSSNLNSKIAGRGLLSGKSDASAVTGQNNRSVSDSDVDSEEEIRAMVKKEMEIEKTEDVESESDHLEIVGDNFELKYNSCWSLSSPDATREIAKGGCREKESLECDNGYDSADTDEIIAESKTPGLSSRKPILEDSKQMKVENKRILTNQKHDLVNDSSLKTQHLKEGTERKEKSKRSKTAAVQNVAVNGSTNTSDSESSYSEPEEGDSEISSDYESMMQNCYRLDLTLDDLKALAAENTEAPVQESGGTQGSSQCNVKEIPKGDVNKPKLSKFRPEGKKKCICPEDVVAEILAGEEIEAEESSKGWKNSRLKYQPFRGMGSLCEELPTDSTGVKERPVGAVGLEACVPRGEEEPAKRQPKNRPLHSLEVTDKKRKNLHCEQQRELSGAATLADESDRSVSQRRLQAESEDVSGLQEDQNSERGDADGSEGEGSDAAVSQKPLKRQLKSPKLLSKKSKRDVSNEKAECDANKREDGKKSSQENKKPCPCAAGSKDPDTNQKQLQDNQRRLAALEERQKERELQKQLIQGALSNLDRQPAAKHKHIIFNLDVESEAEVDKVLKEDASLGNGESAPKASGRLFESSEDEQDDTDNERFQIKPQFEGKAGEKLLQLQSRFGTDERFRMDARFLESDSEEEAETNVLKTNEDEELAAEKKKNLQILGSLLNIDLEHPKAAKTATSAKKFKDINALRYDPTRQDHAVFERKQSATEKESKAKRKKKREESEKLPEVSKETYYDIAVDLKEFFGSSKSKAAKSEEVPWDKDDAGDSAQPDRLGASAGSDEAQDSSTFTFSFFRDTEKSHVKEEPYVIETIKPVKVTWQEDPRFQDSSSDGDDEPEESESERDKEKQTENARFFFFSKDDERLREGPKLFCRSLDFSEEKDDWEDRRRLLLEECRKKHKDARRKVKAK
ncbi:NOL8 protein, partial [Piaya cayana]|nr:NOL8 protein [Piaya cayana]